MDNDSDPALAVKVEQVTAIELANLVERAEYYVSQEISDATKRAYAKDYRVYAEWCKTLQVESMPSNPKIVAIYISYLADSGKSVSTIERALASISKAHEAKEVQFNRKHNAIKKALRGAKRTIGVRPKQVKAILPEDLKKMADTLETDLRGYRNRALLSFGFAGAFRRSEIIALNMDDINRTDNGYIALIRKSKTDQTGIGREVAIPYGSTLLTCPVRSMDKWLEVREMFDTEKEGPLLCGINPKGDTVMTEHRLHPRTVARVVGTSARRAGLEGHYAGHSLRAGLVTTAARAGKAPHIIQSQTGHKNINMIMRYIRRENLFEENAAAGIGL